MKPTTIFPETNVEISCYNEFGYFTPTARPTCERCDCWVTSSHFLTVVGQLTPLKNGIGIILVEQILGASSTRTLGIRHIDVKNELSGYTVLATQLSFMKFHTQKCFSTKRPQTNNEMAVTSSQKRLSSPATFQWKILSYCTSQDWQTTKCMQTQST